MAQDGDCWEKAQKRGHPAGGSCTMTVRALSTGRAESQQPLPATHGVKGREAKQQAAPSKLHVLPSRRDSTCTS